MFYTAIYDNDNVILKPCLKTQKQVQLLIKKYKKYHQCINQLDNAYNLFLYHKSHFKKISINSLKPLNCFLAAPVTFLEDFSFAILSLQKYYITNV